MKAPSDEVLPSLASRGRAMPAPAAVATRPKEKARTPRATGPVARITSTVTAVTARTGRRARRASPPHRRSRRRTSGRARRRPPASCATRVGVPPCGCDSGAATWLASPRVTVLIAAPRAEVVPRPPSRLDGNRGRGGRFPARDVRPGARVGTFSSDHPLPALPGSKDLTWRSADVLSRWSCGRRTPPEPRALVSSATGPQRRPAHPHRRTAPGRSASSRCWPPRACSGSAGCRPRRRRGGWRWSAATTSASSVIRPWAVGARPAARADDRRPARGAGSDPGHG